MPKLWVGWTTLNGEKKGAGLTREEICKRTVDNLTVFSYYFPECKRQFYLLTVLCDRTSPSEPLRHVIDRGSFQFRANLGATRCFVDQVVV